MNVISRNLIAPTLTIYEPLGPVVTHARFMQMIDYWRDFLAERGLKRGDRIIIAMTNSGAMQALFFACLELGIVFLGTQERRFWEFTRYVTSGAVLALVDLEIEHEVPPLPFPVCGFWIVIDDAELDLYPVRTTIEPEASEDDFAVMAITSGSTGLAKTIFHTHRSFLAAVRRAMPLYDASDRVCFYMNLNHLGVLSVFTLPVLLTGCQVILCRTNNPVEVLNAFNIRKAYKSLMFGWCWAKLMELVDLLQRQGQPSFFPALTLITGGGTVTPEMMKSFFDYEVHTVHTIYGMTEAPPPVFIKTTTEWSEDYSEAYLGEVVDGWEYRISDSGTIELKGEGIGFDKNGKPLKTIDGWYRTTDLVTLDDARLMYGGREGLVKRGDTTIYLNDYYGVLPKIFGSNGRTLCLLLKKGKEHRVALCVRNDAATLDGSPITPENINAKLAALLNPLYAVDHIVFMDRFPSNGIKPDLPLIRTAIDRMLMQEDKPVYVHTWGV